MGAFRSETCTAHSAISIAVDSEVGTPPAVERRTCAVFPYPRRKTWENGFVLTHMHQSLLSASVVGSVVATHLQIEHVGSQWN